MSADKLYMRLNAGHKLPYFVLKDDSSSSVTSEMLYGNKTLLLFLKDDGTHSHIKELWDLRDNISKLKDTVPTVYVVLDGSPESLSALRNENKLNFSLLSDTKKEFISACGLKKVTGGVTNAAVFLDSDLNVSNIIKVKNAQDMMPGILNYVREIKDKKSNLA